MCWWGMMLMSERIYGVYWRARDGAGTHTWKEGLSQAEADAEIVWCEGAHPEATLVWSLRGADSNAHKIRMIDHPLPLDRW